MTLTFANKFTAVLGRIASSPVGRAYGKVTAYVITPTIIVANSWNGGRDKYEIAQSPIDYLNIASTAVIGGLVGAAKAQCFAPIWPALPFLYAMRIQSTVHGQHLCDMVFVPFKPLSASAVEVTTTVNGKEVCYTYTSRFP